MSPVNPIKTMGNGLYRQRAGITPDNRRNFGGIKNKYNRTMPSFGFKPVVNKGKKMKKFKIVA